MYTAVIFDLDGTLVDSLYDLADSVNKALLKSGLPAHAVDCYKQFVGNGAVQLIKRAIGKERLTPQLLSSVTQFFNRDYAAHCMDKTRPYNGIEPLLRALQERGVRICVLSNKPDRFVKEMMGRLFPEILFSMAWGKREGFAPKPDPASIFAMLTQLGCSRKACLYVGDSDVDVYTAQNAGLAFCGVEWGFRGREELLSAGAAATADTPEKLLDFIIR